MNEELFNKPIGNKELERLKAKDVTVVHAKFEEKGEKKNTLLVLSTKHPDQNELLDLTKVQFIDGKNVKTVGLWISLDEDENIQKGSSTARFLEFYNVKNISELKDKVLHTVLDDKGYLCIKAY